MIEVSRFVAPLVGACLFAAPAAAQQQDVSMAPGGGLSAAETTWHLRAALNVAALACRGPDGDETVQLYNAMLRNEQAPLEAAAAGSEIAYKIRFAGHWQDAQDAAMTRLYNAYAGQDGREAFCAAAHDVLREAATVEPSSFEAFAAVALPRLRAPSTPPLTPPPPITPLASAPSSEQVATARDEVAGGTAAGIVAIAYNAPPR